MKTAFLLDHSSSMSTPEGARTRHELLAEALEPALRAAPAAKVYRFGSIAAEIVGYEPGEPLPAPAGSTALHLAFDAIAGQQFEKAIVISDGQPDNAGEAIAAARRCSPIIIDCIYVGPEGNLRAMGFMRTLALAGGRAHKSNQLTGSLADVKRISSALLRLAAPEGK